MIIFNGYDFSEDIKILDVKRSILPPSILTSSNIMGRSGAFLFYKQFGAQNIPVTIMLIEKNKVLFRQKVRSLAEKLDTDKPAQLIFSDESDKYINAIISDSSELDEIAMSGKGVINFFCPDPYWYAIQDDIINGTKSGLYEFVRKGTAESYPMIEIQGINVSGSINIKNETSSITFTDKLKTGETLYLDSDLITSYILNSVGETRSVMDKLDNLDFPVLKKGLNKLTITTSGGAIVSKIKITCRSRWK